MFSPQLVGVGEADGRATSLNRTFNEQTRHIHTHTLDLRAVFVPFPLNTRVPGPDPVP